MHIISFFAFLYHWKFVGNSNIFHSHKCIVSFHPTYCFIPLYGSYHCDIIWIHFNKYTVSFGFMYHIIVLSFYIILFHFCLVSYFIYTLGYIIMSSKLNYINVLSFHFISFFVSTNTVSYFIYTQL